MYLGMEMASREPMTPVRYFQAIRIGAHPLITAHFEILAVEDEKTAEFSGVIGFKMTCSRCSMFIQTPTIGRGVSPANLRIYHDCLVCSQD